MRKLNDGNTAHLLIRGQTRKSASSMGQYPLSLVSLRPLFLGLLPDS